MFTAPDIEYVSDAHFMDTLVYLRDFQKDQLTVCHSSQNVASQVSGLVYASDREEQS